MQQYVRHLVNAPLGSCNGAHQRLTVDEKNAEYPEVFSMQHEAEYRARKVVLGSNLYTKHRNMG